MRQIWAPFTLVKSLSIRSAVRLAAPAAITLGLVATSCGLGITEQAAEDTSGDTTGGQAAAETSSGPATAPPTIPELVPALSPASASAPTGAAASSADATGATPLATGAMAALSMPADGLTRALFVADFFAGPVLRYSAASSTPSVAVAEIANIDLLTVQPVAPGFAQVTVTAEGVGGSASQSFVVDVTAAGANTAGTATAAGSSTSEDSAASAPPTPAPPPAPPTGSASEAFVPSELVRIDPPPTTTTLPPTLPSVVPPAAPPAPPPTSGMVRINAVPLEILPSQPSSGPPEAKGSIPAVTVIENQSQTIALGGYFTGTVLRWELATSDPMVAAIQLTSGPQLNVDALNRGTTTVRVTAINELGRVSQDVVVEVKTMDQVVLNTVGDAPLLALSVGSQVRLDLAAYFTEAAKSFWVEHRTSASLRGVDVVVAGSVATITGMRAGNFRIWAFARSDSSTISRPIAVEVSEP